MLKVWRKYGETSNALVYMLPTGTLGAREHLTLLSICSQRGRWERGREGERELHPTSPLGTIYSPRWEFYTPNKAIRIKKLDKHRNTKL